MIFECDEAKNVAKLEKHGISFEEASLIFEGPVLSRLDSRTDYGEKRRVSLGSIGKL